MNVGIAHSFICVLFVDGLFRQLARHGRMWYTPPQWHCPAGLLPGMFTSDQDLFSSCAEILRFAQNDI